MVSREHLLGAILHEINVCKHLFAKVPEGEFDYRPSERQRSTLELLRYLATCAIGPLESMAGGDWSLYTRREEEIADMEPEAFPAVMDRQAEGVGEAFGKISDDDLSHKSVRAPGVGETLLGTAIMRTSYAWLVAYRHELFLRAKAGGNQAIGTANNWAGIDWKPKEEEKSEA